ncbi:thiosulfate/3-mercaptopyruvate sulfurtransferase [Pedobacter psychrotolerans]|uniref:Sulfurtransferase n=1 Tax=Pedobacter psychrotolerans TaxID=1843235 RepID=A0A4R2HJY0_9SPHI|nr:sulfurtransferase [Pedobacter psychrotolerans]TCO29186.1 thiosulfate/3-mercaptopyruvate sulfurtransferase [Pedobacter psychrotolerans]GGE54850.1 sulfurtransferase [Pedobacter psychrotolerans]
MSKLSPIINPEDLSSLNLNEDIVMIDASAGSKARYEEQHLAGSLFVDVNNDLANIGDFAKGGRHPLPKLDQFAQLLQKLGITENTYVIVYDDKNGSNAAARLWWMLRSIGHKKVQVIDGGFQAAVKVGFPTTNQTEIPKSVGEYPISSWSLPLSDIYEVEEVAKHKEYMVIDVRDANRYAGLTEPIDTIAGHIPGAINIPFTENLNEEGHFLSPDVLKEKYIAALATIKPENVIVHCGSGITACHTLLAMDYAGLPIPKLYVGSWSEWSRNNKEMILKS